METSPLTYFTESSHQSARKYATRSSRRSTVFGSDLKAALSESHDRAENILSASKKHVATQSQRHHSSPQWRRADGPRDCVVAQIVGQNDLGSRIRDLLRESGIRCDILYFETPAAISDIMKYIDEDPEAVLGIFVSAKDPQFPTVSLYYDSKLKQELPLAEGVGELVAHYRSICDSSAYRKRLVDFFLLPMISTLDGLTEADAEFALQYYLRKHSFSSCGQLEGQGSHSTSITFRPDNGANSTEYTDCISSPQSPTAEHSEPLNLEQ